MAIRIITDSAADYTVQEIEKRNVTCVSMGITFGDRTFLDGKDLTKEEFFEMLLNEKEFPMTSQPSPMEFLTLFKEAKEAGDDVIVILIAGALSGTIQTAHLAKNMTEYENIYIIDSQTATLGMRILVDHAVVMRAQGYEAKDIVREVEELRSKIKIYAGLNTLEYLAKGGRLSKTQASIGNMVNLKPVVEVSKEGSVEVCGKQIGMRHAFKQVEKLMAEHVPDETYPMYFLYAQDKKNCISFIKYLHKNGMELTEPKLRGIGATIGSHIGPGAFGIVYVEK